MRSAKFRWSKVYESSEEELRQFLADHKITAQQIHLDEFTQTEGQVVTADTTLYCAEGSMTVVVGSDKLAVQPGDAVMITANQSYYIDAGFTGCVYYAA